MLLSVLASLSYAFEYKAVFDCSSKDMGYIASRMVLVERTMDMMEQNGDTVKAAVTIHGGCAPIVSKNFDELILDQESLKAAALAQKQLVKLSQRGVDVIVCDISLNANTIPKEDVIKEVKRSQNSFIETIGYQNKGYALMLFE